MKRTIFFAASIFALATLGMSFAHAQKKATADDFQSIFYRVSGKGLAKPSYLFGTFHAVCSEDMVPFSTIGPYLDQTDQVVMEIALDDPAELTSLATGLMMKDGKTLKDLLTPEQFAKVDEMTRNVLGRSAENLKTIKPIMLSVMIITDAKMLGCAATQYDISLMQLAAAKNKQLIGLETVAGQFAVMDGKPIATQAKELYEMAVDPQKASRQIKELLSAYKSRDSEKLYEFSARQMADDKAFLKRILDDRNIAWLPRVETAIKAKPSLIAVGAAHLGGEKGLVRLLRTKGYQVTPVKL
ncbi:MAG TPA: TraB/GumN family protein [Pyrinomonadaceae bacterium]